MALSSGRGGNAHAGNGRHGDADGSTELEHRPLPADACHVVGDDGGDDVAERRPDAAFLRFHRAKAQRPGRRPDRPVRSAISLSGFASALARSFFSTRSTRPAFCRR